MMKFFIALIMTVALTGCNRSTTTVDGIIASAQPLEMSSAEKEYINTHVVTMAYPRNIAPVIYDNNGKPDGYAAKVAELIVKRTGLRVKYVLYETNAAMIPAFVNKKIDVVVATTDIIERRSLVTVSRPYKVANGVMLVDELPIKFPMKVAIGSKYAIQESIAKLAGFVVFTPFDDDELGFQALMRKEVGGAIMSQPIADYLEKKYSRLYAHSTMNFVFNVGFGSQVSETILSQILNKGVDSFTSDEQQIFEKTFFVKPLADPPAPIKYGP